MNEEDKISKNLIIFIFIGCLVLLVIVAASVIMYSPKTFIPVFSESEEDISDKSSYSCNKSDSEFNDELPAESSDCFPIEINTASSEEIQLIPDIGPKTAKLIIDYRNEYGTITDFDELLSIDGIGEKTVELLEKYCIIN